ncbi:GPR endopeptidase [Selenomonadales bacterium OttesenSCG-928-I06]|nr:GPR endopeptidase [Selenomonadales bacterium OttesenSCG-928-I06]
MLQFEGNVRTDLALEASEQLTRKNQSNIDGLAIETIEDEDVIITRVDITTKDAAERMGKAEGRYVTVEALGLRYKNTELERKVMNYLTKELANILQLPEQATILVVGLGNWNITPDALGPRAVDKVVVTRHLKEILSPELKDEVREVCAISPGVLGITGMETAEIIQGIVQKIKPDVVIAVDALAAASSQRVTTTIQIANTGITPGSGVENKRFGLTQETLNTPVIAIGVPTVVQASTIALDTLNVMQENAFFARYLKSMASISDQDKRAMIDQIIPETLGDLMVTPKEVDRLIEDMALIVAGGINQALHPNIDYKNIHLYLN